MAKGGGVRHGADRSGKPGSRALAEHDTEMRFRMRAARGDTGRGLKLLDELDHRHAEAGFAK